MISANNSLKLESDLLLCLGLKMFRIKFECNYNVHELFSFDSLFLIHLPLLLILQPASELKASIMIKGLKTYGGTEFVLLFSFNILHASCVGFPSASFLTYLGSY